MQHPTIVIPALAHLTQQQLKKLDLASSLFPDIPRETLLEQLILQSPEQGIHSNLRELRDLIRTATGYPNRVPLLDEAPTEISSFSQSFEAIIQGLNDDQLSVEDFETHLEDFKTHLEADPRVKQILEDFMSQTKYPDAQELFEQLRAENPELVNEVEEYRAFIEALDGVFNPPQGDAATDAAGTTGSLETPAADVIRAQEISNIVQTEAMRMFEHVRGDAATDAVGTIGSLETPAADIIGAQEISNMVQTASAFAGMSILARIIWRNLKHLQKFYKNVGDLRSDVESLNKKYENKEITEKEYELGVDEATRKLEELLPEPVSISLDTIYPNWTATVLGVKEEYRPAESNPFSAIPEPSGQELAQAFIEHIADGNFYFAAAVDYIVPSMTESDLDSFLTEIRDADRTLRDESEITNIDPYEAACAEWFVQLDNSYHSNLSLPDLEALATKLIGIRNRLSSSQLDELDEVKELYWSDPSSVNATWKDKAIGWFSTLNEDLHTDIQEAYEIVNPSREGSDSSGVREDIQPQQEVEITATELSPNEQIVEGLYDINKAGDAATELSPNEQIVEGLYDINKAGDAATELSPNEQIVEGLRGGESDSVTNPLSQDKAATEPAEPISPTLGKVNLDP